MTHPRCRTLFPTLRRGIVVLVCILGLGLCTTLGRAAGRRTSQPASDVEGQKLALDRERLQLDRLKMESDLQLQRERLAMERAKIEQDAANARRGSLISLLVPMIPLIAAIATLFYSIWSFRTQMRKQTELQNEAARLQFEMKAAEIAFTGKSPEAVRNRAKALKSMFGVRLPEEFANTFDPTKYGGGKEPAEAKQFFLELLLKYPDKCPDIAAYWDALFGEEWVDRVRPLLKAAAAGQLGGPSSPAPSPPTNPVP